MIYRAFAPLKKPPKNVTQWDKKLLFLKDELQTHSKKMIQNNKISCFELNEWLNERVSESANEQASKQARNSNSNSIFLLCLTFQKEVLVGTSYN